MVRREADGNTLYFIDTDKVKQEFTVREYQYEAVDQTQQRQITAARVNRRVRGNYNDWVTNIAQVNEDASRPYPKYGGAMNDDNTPIPADIDGKPAMWVVADPTMDEFGAVTQGAESWEPFAPPLLAVRKKFNVSPSK